MGKARQNGTIEYFKSNTWSNLQKRCINCKPHIKNISYIIKGIELRMTKDEFYGFCELNRQLIEQMYSENVKPSIDRIDHEDHYSLVNIRIISNEENRKESNYRNREKFLNASTLAKQKAVILIHPNGIEEEFESFKHVRYKYNFLDANYVSRVARGLKNNYKGFKAKLKE